MPRSICIPNLKFLASAGDAENAGLENNGLEFDGQKMDGQQRRTNAVENHLEVTYLQRKTTRQCEKLKGPRRAIAINPVGRQMPPPTLRKCLYQLCNRFLEP